ncbi:hypothetical protein BOX15_Mlig026393g5 [Macrostomum lignano]|uniref:BEN domain-containing protein n=1 Tax=Macrostomum lignano TaxID=282301 RepID=A0A267G5C5_9PLAT|nr:hypothetical protein BOX15_Mlig026393g5 [Macrostomum lignano]
MASLSYENPPFWVVQGTETNNRQCYAISVRRIVKPSPAPTQQFAKVLVNVSSHNTRHTKPQLLQAELLKGPFDNKEAASRAMQCCQLPDETYCIDLDCDSCSVLHRKMAVVEEQMDRLKNELQSAKAAASERRDLLLKEVDAHKSTQRRLEVANAEMDDLRQEIDRLRTTGESSEFQSNVIRIMQDFAAQSLATSQTPASVAPAIHASPSIEVISEILGEDQRVPLLASAPNVTITREQKAAIEHAVAELRREPGDKQLRKLTRLLIRSLFSTSELCVTTVSGMAKKQQIRMPANCHIVRTITQFLTAASPNPLPDGLFRNSFKYCSLDARRKKKRIDSSALRSGGTDQSSSTETSALSGGGTIKKGEKRTKQQPSQSSKRSKRNVRET